MIVSIRIASPGAKEAESATSLKPHLATPRSIAGLTSDMQNDLGTSEDMRTKETVVLTG